MLGAAREAEKNNDWTSAAWYYRELLNGEPESRRYSAALAFAQYKLRQYPAALETLAMHPNSPEGGSDCGDGPLPLRRIPRGGEGSF
ncbi:MAG: hypothetical protein L6W00_16380 [Lentisphaeria bacterium]|nr:MAG: hypothetical protein L6W00_16380 [Lentisphaeria bacterium]